MRQPACLQVVSSSSLASAPEAQKVSAFGLVSANLVEAEGIWRYWKSALEGFNPVESLGPMEKNKNKQGTRVTS